MLGRGLIEGLTWHHFNLRLFLLDLPAGLLFPAELPSKAAGLYQLARTLSFRGLSLLPPTDGAGWLVACSRGRHSEFRRSLDLLLGGLEALGDRVELLEGQIVAGAARLAGSTVEAGLDEVLGARGGPVGVAVGILRVLAGSAGLGGLLGVTRALTVIFVFFLGTGEIGWVK